MLRRGVIIILSDQTYGFYFVHHKTSKIQRGTFKEVLEPEYHTVETWAWISKQPPTLATNQSAMFT